MSIKPTGTARNPAVYVLPTKSSSDALRRPLSSVSVILRIFDISKNVTSYFFSESTCQEAVKRRQQSLVLNPSKMSSVITIIQQGLSLVFPNNWLLKLKIWLGYDANIIT